MTLLVASIKGQEAILLKDCCVSSGPKTDRIRTDEINKYFKIEHNEHVLHLYTSGSVQVWEKIQKTLDIASTFLNKSSEQSTIALTTYLQSESFRSIRGKDHDSGGFAILENKTTKHFQYYKITLSPNYGGIVTPLSDGTYALGSGKSIVEDSLNGFHNSVWSRNSDSMFQKQDNLANQIKVKFEPWNKPDNLYEQTGVSKHFTTMIIENGQIQPIDSETDELSADLSGIRENKLSTTHNPDGSITVESQLSGTQRLKPYGEQLDRDGKKIEHL
ncbi:hypothetical protein D3C80_1158950 [compost metagenome]